MPNVVLINNSVSLLNTSVFVDTNGTGCCCGPPPPCWAHFHVCACSPSTDYPDLYFPCDLWQQGGMFQFVQYSPTGNPDGILCYHFAGIVTELPPNAIFGGSPVLSCDTCCGTCPTPGFCDTNCSHPFHAAIPSYNVPAEDGGGHPCQETIPAHSILLDKHPGCFWSGQSADMNVAIICPDFQITVPVHDSGFLQCGFDDPPPDPIVYWWYFVLSPVAGANAGYKSHFPAHSNFCPVTGGYSKIYGPSWTPGSVVIT